MKHNWILVGTILVILVVGIGSFGVITDDGSRPYKLQASFSKFNMDTEFPASPATAPVFKVVEKEAFTIGSERLMAIKPSIPSEEEAPAMALKTLENYGGLPKDAVLHKVEQVHINKYNLTTESVEEQYPQWTLVIYEQQIQGMPVIGPGAEIWIALGDNGELLQIDKVWRTVEYSKEVPIITAEQAYERLNKGELLTRYQSPLEGIEISSIYLGYYAENRDTDQEYFKPIWIFHGKDLHNNTIRLPVSATLN